MDQRKKKPAVAPDRSGPLFHATVISLISSKTKRNTIHRFDPISSISCRFALFLRTREQCERSLSRAPSDQAADPHLSTAQTGFYIFNFFCCKTKIHFFFFLPTWTNIFMHICNTSVACMLLKTWWMNRERKRAQERETENIDDIKWCYWTSFFSGGVKGHNLTWLVMRTHQSYQTYSYPRYMQICFTGVLVFFFSFICRCFYFCFLVVPSRVTNWNFLQVWKDKESHV